jgi:hypothetical protein
MPEVRPYAAAELNRRAGHDFWDNPLPGLEPIHCDSAVMASSPALQADGLRQHVRSVLQVREAPGQRRDSQVLGSASENFRPASVFSSASGSTECPARGERTDGHVRAAVLDHERADQLANPPTCGKCGSPVDRARNRRGRDDYRLHWVYGSQMPNLPSPGSGEAPGQRQ